MLFNMFKGAVAHGKGGGHLIPTRFPAGLRPRGRGWE